MRDVLVFVIVASLLMTGCSYKIEPNSLPVVQEAPMSTTPPKPVAMKMGIDWSSVDDLRDEGVPVEYGSNWIGHWLLNSGWRGTEQAFRSMVAQDITPFLHFYYWGDDLSALCLQNGCDTSQGRKDRANWDRLAQEFVDAVNRNMPDQPVVVVLETEFNKIGPDGTEAMDLALAEKAMFLRDNLPEGSRIVLGLGTWGDGAWDQYDQAAAASDAIGLQMLRATTRNDGTSYAEIGNRAVAAATYVHDLFDKPIVITDLGLSSYPEPDGLDLQHTALLALRNSSAALAAVGVDTIVYRSYRDTNMSTTNHFGEGERWWGLVSKNETPKPAYEVWATWAKLAE